MEALHSEALDSISRHHKALRNEALGLMGLISVMVTMQKTSYSSLPQTHEV